MEKQKVLDVLNNFDVLESNGGDEPYVLVEFNDDVIAELNAIGIDVNTAKKYGDSETFCILAFAYHEGYANWYDGSKLKNYDMTYHEIALKGLKETHKLMLDTSKEVSPQTGWLAGFGAAIDFLEENY
ncbi:hypothetical protein [Halobacillus litoralis]|uniref:hypothetical protein n=1 Tax=Halobacillus litoralis TaxID=45668 RepID=UPI001CD64049|nr:hypothetical protein [Halobacillus litoralis]MCA1021811.1 hypothetical protein [Halobacillus litoralis]